MIKFVKLVHYIIQHYKDISFFQNFFHERVWSNNPHVSCRVSCMSDMCDLNWGRKSSEERLTQLGAWGSCTCHDHSSIFHILVCQKLLETVWDKKDLLNKFCKCHLTFSILSPLMNPFLIWYKYWHSISSSTAVFIPPPPPPKCLFLYM